MTDIQIYRDAWARYRDRVSHDFVVWMGGVAGPEMEPGVADYGIYQRAFFTDLSANPKVRRAEYALADSILGTMSPSAGSSSGGTRTQRTPRAC